MTSYVAFDIETTGLIPIQERILEIAGVRFDAQGQILGSFSELIYPGISIPAQATRINRITDEDVEGKPTIEHILPMFIDFIGDSVLVAHNAEFDTTFLGAEMILHGLNHPTNPIWDSLSIARQLIPGRLNYKLETLVHHFALPLREFHRALEDSTQLMKVFLRLISSAGGIEEIKKYTPVMQFSKARSLFDVPLNFDLMALKKAMSKKLSVRFMYEGQDGTRTEIELNPDFVYRADKYLWVRGFTSLNPVPASFRLDRISRVVA